jgi:sortase B
MFGALAQYESEAFYREHPNVRFDTIYGTGTYEIVAVVRTDATIGSSAFPYYSYTQANDPDALAEYADYLEQNRIYDTGRTIQPGDKVLTLSTCNYHTANGRLIVVCRKTA